MIRLTIIAAALLILAVTLNVGWQAQAQGPIPTNAPLFAGTPTPARLFNTPTPTPTEWNRVKQCRLDQYHCRFVPGVVGMYFFEIREWTITGRLLNLHTGEPMAHFPVKWPDVYQNWWGEAAVVYSTAETPSTYTDNQGYFTKTFTPLTYWGVITMVGYLDGSGFSYYQLLYPPIYPANDPNVTALDIGTIYTKLNPIAGPEGAAITNGIELIIK